MKQVNSLLQDIHVARPRRRSTVSLWLEYNPTYFKIEQQLSPAARAYCRQLPGYKFMRRGWRIALVIFIVLSIIGRASQLGLF